MTQSEGYGTSPFERIGAKDVVIKMLRCNAGVLAGTPAQLILSRGCATVIEAGIVLLLCWATINATSLFLGALAKIPAELLF
jgi:hypothetical protein